MNAYELADLIDSEDTLWMEGRLNDICNMLRQQADRIADYERWEKRWSERVTRAENRIAELEKEVLMWENAEVPTEVMADLIQELERRKFITTPQIKELGDEEINRLWAESHEDGIAMQQGFTTQQHYFAHLLLKKASEK